MKYRRKLTTSVLLCIFIVSVVFALGTVSKILTAIKAAQVIESQLNQDIMSLAQDIVNLQKSILDMENRKGEMIETRDQLWYVANEAYTEYLGAMAVGDSEAANYYWNTYMNSTASIQYWTDQIYWMDYEIFVFTELSLKPKQEKLKQKEQELKDILAEIDRLNALLDGDDTE